MLDSKIEKQILETLGKAGGVAEETLSTIRNVIAFGARNKLVGKYEEYLDTVQKLGIKKGMDLGSLYGWFDTNCDRSVFGGTVCHAILVDVLRLCSYVLVRSQAVDQGGDQRGRQGCYVCFGFPSIES